MSTVHGRDRRFRDWKSSLAIHGDVLAPCTRAPRRFKFFSTFRGQRGRDTTYERPMKFLDRVTPSILHFVSNGELEINNFRIKATRDKKKYPAPLEFDIGTKNNRNIEIIFSSIFRNVSNWYCSFYHRSSTRESQLCPVLSSDRCRYILTTFFVKFAKKMIDIHDARIDDKIDV